MANFGQVVLFTVVMMAWFGAVAVGGVALVTGLTLGRVKAVQVSPDGVALAVAGPSDLLLLETATGCELWSRLVYEGARRVVFVESARPPGARIVADALGFRMTLWSLESGRALRRVWGYRWSAGVAGAVTLDGRLAAFGGVRTARRGGIDQQFGALKLVETESRHEHILDGHDKAVFALAFHPDGSLLASGGADQTIRLWETATGKEQAVLTAHDATVTSLSFSPDGSLLVSGSEDKTVRLWDVAGGVERNKLEGHTGPVTCVAFSPDGRCVASCSADTTVRLWEAATGKELRRMEGHAKKVNALAFSPDGAFLVSGGDDKTVRAWDPSTGAQLWRLTAKRVGNYGVRFERA
jgi:WD40 repeat protein